MVQLVDLKRFCSMPDGTIFYNDRKMSDEEKELMKFVCLPMDFPGYLRVMRVTKQPRKDGAATIWDIVAVTLELTMFTFGFKLYVRVGKDGTCRIITEDHEGREKLAEYTREK